jgi:hypothetical protein
MTVVQQGQNMMDIAIQHCGDARSLFDLAVLNDLSATDEVAPGTDLKIPTPAQPGIVAYFQNGGYVPATNNDANIFSNKEGIGFWIIGVDFKVS